MKMDASISGSLFKLELNPISSYRRAGFPPLPERIKPHKFYFCASVFEEKDNSVPNFHEWQFGC